MNVASFMTGNSAEKWCCGSHIYLFTFLCFMHEFYFSY